jgi:outer membrane protein TolC
MSTLGVTALAGVVVNNAIVLLDLADTRVKSGDSLKLATQHAVRARTRPILLTSVTTMAGLLPLATSTSSLWPPLAWAMISGLAASTLLTLLVVPALYMVLMKSTRPSMLALIPAVVLGLSPTLLSQPARAQAPDGDATVSTPADETSAAEQPLEAFDLEKALIAESGGLTADEVSRLARARSPQIRGAEAVASQALWDANNATTGFLPQVELFARYSRVNLIPNQLSGGFGGTPTTTNPLVIEALQELGMIFEDSPGFNVTQPVNQYSVGVTASLPLSNLFLQVWPSYRGMVGLAESQAVQAEVTYALVDQQARSAFYGYARAVAQRVVAEQAVKQAQAQAGQIKLFVDAGTSAPVDFMTATARLAQARGALAAATGQMRIARNRVATLSGLAVSEVDGIAEPIISLPEEPQLNADELRARAFQLRPELKALRKLVSAQEKLTTAQRNSGLPQLVLSASDLYAQPNPRVFPPNTDEFKNSWEVGASVVWRPNDTYAGYTATRKAEASVAKARADLGNQEDAVRIEVVQAYENYLSAVEVARASESQLKAAEEAYRVRLAMYRVGAGVMVDLLNADLEVSQARLAHVNAALDARDALAVLRRVAVLED